MNPNGINAKLAVTLTFLIPTAIVAWMHLYLDTPFEELPFDIFWIGIYVLPFWIFLLADNRSILLWVLQAALTALIWVSLGLIARNDPGVNFGGALLLLFGPAIAGLVSFGTHDAMSRMASK